MKGNHPGMPLLPDLEGCYLSLQQPALLLQLLHLLRQTPTFLTKETITVAQQV